MFFNQQYSNLDLEDKVYFNGRGNVIYLGVKAMKTCNVTNESKWASAEHLPALHQSQPFAALFSGVFKKTSQYIYFSGVY